MSVFYDGHEEAYLWGKDLIRHLDHVYRHAARYCVVFVSAHYVSKAWTRHEQRSAQARAFLERSEYLLPARFDDTELPGLPPTVRYVDLRNRAPESLADLLCEKLGQSAAVLAHDPSGSTLPIGWAEPLRLRIGDEIDQLPLYQGAPVIMRLPALESLVDRTMQALGDLVRRDNRGLYWTSQQDRYFDRLYVTSAVASALRQLGAADDSRLLQGAEDFLRGADHGSIDDRAASVHLLVAGQLSDQQENMFLEVLALHQAPMTDIHLGGSFLLPQGPNPSGTRPNWSTAPLHADGASFHACHMADVLLHIRNDHQISRARAASLLAGIRGFLARSLAAHEGWLVDISGQRTPLTLYGYSVCPALSVPLPRDWRAIAAAAIGLLKDDRYAFVVRCFGVMNAWYLYCATRDAEFRSEARGFVSALLAEAPSLVGQVEGDARSIAALQRAILCGVNFLDERFGPAVTIAARASVSAADQSI